MTGRTENKVYPQGMAKLPCTTNMSVATITAEKRTLRKLAADIRYSKLGKTFFDHRKFMVFMKENRERGWPKDLAKAAALSQATVQVME
jgi:hypothetical protein